MEAEEALQLLTRGEIDIAVAEEYDYAPRARDPSLSFRDVCRDPLVLVLPADHPLGAADAETVPLAALAEEVWASTRAGTAFDDAFVRACRALGGFEPGRPPSLQRHRGARAARGGGRGGRADAVARAPRAGARRGVRRVAEGRLDRRIFLAARRGSTGRAAIKVVSRALRDQAAALGLPRP